jgi:hypothetical protein
MDTYAIPDDEKFRYTFRTGKERRSQKVVTTNKKVSSDENCTDVVIRKIQRCTTCYSYITVN